MLVCILEWKIPKTRGRTVKMRAEVEAIRRKGAEGRWDTRTNELDLPWLKQVKVISCGLAVSDTKVDNENFILNNFGSGMIPSYRLSDLIDILLPIGT